MRITVGSTIRVHSKDRNILRALREGLTFPNPARREAERLQLPHHHLPETLTFYSDVRSDIVRAPRGSVDLAMRIARQHGAEIDWVSRVVRNAAPPRPLTSLNVQLRPEYQIPCVERMLRVPQGVVELPCGGGKTTIGAAALVASGYAGLVVVHTAELLASWTERIEEISGIAPRVFDGFNCLPLRPGEVCVAMVQKLSSMDPSGLVPILRSVGALVVDEVHHVPAGNWQTVASQCPARVRWGLTATLERADGFDFLFEVLIGPTIFRESAKKLVEWGYLKRPIVIPVATGWHPGEHLYQLTKACPSCRKINRVTSDHSGPVKCRSKRCGVTFEMKSPARSMVYGTALAERSRDSSRQDVIAYCMQEGMRRGRTVLGLVASKISGAGAERRLKEREVFDACFVSSATAKGARRRAIENLSAGQGLIATNLADEGLDIPHLDWLVNAAGGKAGGKAKQRAGRTSRTGGASVPVVIDLVDDAPTFTRQWKSRKRAYLREYGPGAIGVPDPIRPDELSATVDRLLGQE